jgi:type IV pilus assembly protein PilM
MLRLPRPTIPAIGLDVGSESIKMLQIAESSGGLKVFAAKRIPIPDDVKGNPDKRVIFAGQMVKATLRQGLFRGCRIAAALPKELVHYKTHRLSPMRPEDIAAAAKIDARDLFRFDPDSAEVKCLDAGEVGRGNDLRREVILVAAGKQYIDDYVRALHVAGAEISSLGIDPCAIWRAAVQVQPSDPAAAELPRVVLDIGAAQSRLVIGRGDVIRVVKTIDIGADHLRNAISRKLGLPIVEAEQLRRRSAAPGSDRLDGMRKVLSDATRHVTELIAREVLSCMRYHAVTFRGPSPRRVELVGGDAHDAQIRSILSAALMLPAKPVKLFRDIDTSVIPSTDQTASLGEWAVALGLCLKDFPIPVPSTIRVTAATEQAILAPLAAVALGASS